MPQRSRTPQAHQVIRLLNSAIAWQHAWKNYKPADRQLQGECARGPTTNVNHKHKESWNWFLNVSELFSSKLGIGWVFVNRI